MISFILLLFQIIKGGNIKMAKKTKVVKASLAAALVTSAIVPVASAQTSATTTEVSSVIIEQNGQLIKIPMTVYSDLLGAGKIPTVKHIVLNNAETFTIDQFSEALGAYNDLNQTLGHLAEKSEPVTPSGVVDGKVENGEIVPGETPSTPEVEVDSVDAGGTLYFVVGKTPTLPNTVDALVTDTDGNTKTVSGLSVVWNEEDVKGISTEEEGNSGTIKATVTFQGVEYTVEYTYEVVATSNEAKKLAALEKMDNIANNDLMAVEAAASAANDAASNASDEASSLSEESTDDEKNAVKKLVSEASNLIAKVENDIQQVKAAFDEAKAVAMKLGATADDFYTDEELDTSSVEEYLAEAKGYIADAEAYIKGEELPVRVTDAVAINDKTIKVTFSDGHVQEYTLEKALVEGENKVTVEHDGKKYEVTVTYTAPAVEELKITSADAMNTTKVQVNLSTAVDTVAAANFSIDGATVTGAVFANESKRSVILTVSGLQVEKSYTVTAKGLEVDGKVQKDLTATFTVPDINTLYSPTLSFDGDRTELKADGADKVLVTFKLDEDIKNAEDVVVAFTTTFGKFGQQRVTVQNGVATVMLNSEFFTELKTAQITAQVVEAADTNLIGLKAETTINLNPNPNNGESETVGASLTDAESNQADRVTLYFNRDVDVSKFVAANTKAGYDAKKAQIDITQDGAVKTVKGILPVAGNSKAIQVLVDETTPLTDNKKVDVTFTDKTGSVEVEKKASFILTDARTPELLSVVADGLYALTATFSEPIYDTGNLQDLLTINGKKLTDEAYKAVAKVVGFDAAEGTDARHVIRIELGKDKSNNQIYFKPGAYSLQATQISDWAAKSDDTTQITNQTLDFNIAADDSVPTATVEVQSPEQFVLSFDRKTNATAASVAKALEFQVKDKATGQYNKDTRVSNFADTLSGLSTNGFVVSEIPGTNQFLIELNTDWTKVYKTSTSKENFYNDSFRLVLAEGAVAVLANGNKNAETVLGLGGALLQPDTTSPVIVDVTEAKTGFDIELSEPSKVKVKRDKNVINLNAREGETLGEQQQDLQYASVEFIKADNSKTIQGTINGFGDTYDKVLNVTPKDKLEAGEWKVVVRSISDDYGNVAASREFKFTVGGEGPAAAEPFRVVWVEADNNFGGTGQEAIKVKFNKAGSLVGDFKNILKASNYTFNGSDLPRGSQIVADIKGYDDYDQVTDSITILLPAGSLKDSNVLNISDLLESTVAGDKLQNPGEYVLGNKAATTVNVANQEELDAALADELVTSIKITTDFGKTAVPAEPIVIDRAVNVELGTNVENLVFDTEQSGTIKLSGAHTVANLTVNTPNAEFKLEQGTTATKTLLEDTFSKTFTNDGTIGTVTITDVNGAGFETGINGTTNKVIIDTTGAVTLGGAVTNVELEEAADVTVAEGATVTTITANAAGANITVAPNATVTNLNLGTGVAASEITLVNNGTVTTPAPGITQTVDSLKVTEVVTNTSGDTVTLTFSSNVTTSGDTIKLTEVTNGETTADTATVAVKSGGVNKISLNITGTALQNSDKRSFTVTRREDNKDIAYTVTVQYVNGRLEVAQPVKATN